MPLPVALTQFLASVHPYDSLPDTVLTALAQRCALQTVDAGATIFSLGEEVAYLYIIVTGEVEITDETGVQLSILGAAQFLRGTRAVARRDRQPHGNCKRSKPDHRVTFCRLF